MRRYRVRERIVSAGVEDDDIGTGIRHRVLEAGKVDGAQSQGRFAFASGVNRQKIVFPIQLNAMSGIEEKSEFTPRIFSANRAMTFAISARVALVRTVTSYPISPSSAATSVASFAGLGRTGSAWYALLPITSATRPAADPESAPAIRTSVAMKRLKKAEKKLNKRAVIWTAGVAEMPSISSTAYRPARIEAIFRTDSSCWCSSEFAPHSARPSFISTLQVHGVDIATMAMHGFEIALVATR